jgi:GNAT superfamily N-acetyltransferase
MPSAATHHPFVSRLAALRDGTIVLLREQTPRDRGQLADLFAGLSSRSRYLRFGTGTPPALPRRYLDVLADVDGDRHVAILAIHDTRAVGAARYIRTGAAEAEIAVTVTDAFQRRGMGRVLVESLTVLGVARGVEHFSFEILPANRAARALADRLNARERTLTTELPAHAAPELVATWPTTRRAA